MIAKAEWFAKRKYAGWGVMPKTWQGVLYVTLFVGIISFVQMLPVGSLEKMAMIGIMSAVFLVDILHVMASMKLDEREQYIEAIAERNASWTMVSALACMILFVTTLGKDMKGTDLLPVLISPIVLGAIAKGISYYILER